MTTFQEWFFFLALPIKRSFAIFFSFAILKNDALFFSTIVFHPNDYRSHEMQNVREKKFGTRFAKVCNFKFCCYIKFVRDVKWI